MRTIQDYRTIYRTIANNLNITGDSVELLVQLLANASYIDEVENINYALEGSLERCSLINSKIQHCEDDMYSVFRGRCPRVLLRFKPTKYFTFNPFDRIITSNSFSVYYLGYYKPEENDTINEITEEEDIDRVDILPVEEGFLYSNCTVSPATSDDDTTVIIGLIAPDVIDKTWATTSRNTYYVECLDKDLSNDMYLYMGTEDNPDYLSITRTFSEHILDHKVFDLTTTDFGSRLYVADVFKSENDLDITDDEENTTDANIILTARYFRYSHLSSYNTNELKKMNISGAQMVTFKGFEKSEEDEKDFLTRNGHTEIAPGVVLIDEVARDEVNTIHYKANRDRFVSTILRTNSDVGTILEETYPEKVKSNGTNFIFETGGSGGSIGSRVILYYVPNSITNTLTPAEISNFQETKQAYYVTDVIEIEAGSRYTALLNIDLELYQPQDVESDIKSILETFENKFNIDLEDSKDNIRTLISKISNVKQVRELEITYLSSTGAGEVTLNDLYGEDTNPETRKIKPNIYFNIEYNINSIVQSKS